WQPGELWARIAGLGDGLFLQDGVIVLQTSTHKDTVISVLSEVDVDLGNVGVELARCRSGKIETCEVQAITNGIGVRVWIGLEHLQHSGISSGTEGACSVARAT